MSRAALVGFYGMLNFGDDLFRVVVDQQLDPVRRQQLRVAGPPLSGTTTRSVGPSFLTHSVGRIDWLGSVSRTGVGISAMLGRPTIVLGGGSVLTSVTGVRRVQQLISRFSRHRFIGLGVSLGPFPDRESRTRVTRLLSRFSYLSLRDRRSYERAEAIEAGCPFELSGDLAALYQPPEGTTKRYASHRVLGVVVCNTPRLTPHHYAQMAAGIAAYVRRQDGELSVSMLSLNNHPRYGDDGLMASIRAILEKESINCEERRYVDIGVANTWHALSGLDAVLSVRLHGAIPAYLSGVPFVLVEYQSKCRDFLDDIGQPSGLRLAPDGGSPDDIAQALDEVLNASYSPALKPECYRQRVHENGVAWASLRRATSA